MQEAETLLQKSVDLAIEARDKFWETKQKSPGHRYNRALVVASIGSYGAYLADGSEYSGIYGSDVDVDKLKDFHKKRLRVIVEAGPDLLAFETIPNKLETQAIVELLDDENIQIPSWICFSSVDGEHAPSGESFNECLEVINKSNRVTVVGINCTPPQFIESLICKFKEVTDKPIIVYPNSGEVWDGKEKKWLVVTDSSIENRGGITCVAGLECLLSIIRALRMGSCLSADGRNALSHSSTPTSASRKKRQMKKKGSRGSSFDSRRDEQLRKIPGRMFLNGASDVASIFTQQGKKGTNQDAMIVWENFGSRTDTIFCGVFDGHGPFGHLVARRVRDSLPLKLSAHWDVNIGSEDGSKGNISAMGSMNSEETASLCADEESAAAMQVMLLLWDKWKSSHPKPATNENVDVNPTPSTVPR